MESCAKHPHEVGVAYCGRCGGAWCHHCLVWAYGPKKPPFCLSCAMVAGGVRQGSARPAMPRREMKARLKAAKAEAKAAAKAARAAAKQTEAPAEDASVAAFADEGPTTDWGSPWWEDREPTLAD